MNLLLIIAAIVCWAVGAATGFGWFGAHLDVNVILGWVSLGLVFFGLSALVPPVIERVRTQ